MGSSVWRKGGSISGALKPLVAAAIRVGAAVAIWMGHLVGVCGMSTRVRHGTRSNKDGKRHEEGDLGFGHHDGSLLKFAQCQGLCGKPAAREPLSLAAFWKLDDLTLRP